MTERGRPTRTQPEASMDTQRGWHSRGYLPHFDGPGVTQAITFRLADSLPKEVVERWQNELQPYTPEDRKRELRRRIHEWLDAGHGECLLRRSDVAVVVQDALLHFDGERYELLNWCVMPNHVHTLINPLPRYALSGIVHSWKSFTAKAINRVLRRQGQVWMPDYFDRYMRDKKHFAAAMKYIDENPTRAKLCVDPADWP
ncbi:MAG: transposase [Planctomycetes bacterium]|nr:transposase [Planctomycetota bacterium]